MAVKTVEAEVVYTKDRSSGRVHERYRIEGSEKLTTREGCNLDEAGAYDEITEAEMLATNPALLCRNDFPLVEDQVTNLATSPDSDDGTVEDDDGEV